MIVEYLHEIVKPFKCSTAVSGAKLLVSGDLECILLYIKENFIIVKFHGDENLKKVEDDFKIYFETIPAIKPNIHLYYIAQFSLNDPDCILKVRQFLRQFGLKEIS